MSAYVVSVPRPGDIGFEHTPHDFGAWWIRLAESWKYGKTPPKGPAYWNHVFMITGANEVIEARPQGTVRAPLEPRGEYILVRPHYPDKDGAQRAVEGMTKLLGDGYGFLTIMSEILVFGLRSKLRFNVDGTEICSGAVSHALEYAGIDMGTDAEWNSPADVYAILTK